VLDYWLERAVPDSVTLTITDPSGALVRRFSSQDRPESLAAGRYFEAAWLAAPRRLSGLVDDMQSADAAPTQGEKAALKDCAQLVDGLLARWRKLQATMAANQAR